MATRNISTKWSNKHGQWDLNPNNLVLFNIVQFQQVHTLAWGGRQVHEQ